MLKTFLSPTAVAGWTGRWKISARPWTADGAAAERGLPLVRKGSCPPKPTLHEGLHEPDSARAGRAGQP